MLNGGSSLAASWTFGRCWALRAWAMQVPLSPDATAESDPETGLRLGSRPQIQHHATASGRMGAPGGGSSQSRRSFESPGAGGPGPSSEAYRFMAEH